MFDFIDGKTKNFWTKCTRGFKQCPTCHATGVQLGKGMKHVLKIYTYMYNQYHSRWRNYPDQLLCFFLIDFRGKKEFKVKNHKSLRYGFSNCHARNRGIDYFKTFALHKDFKKNDCRYILIIKEEVFLTTYCSIFIFLSCICNIFLFCRGAKNKKKKIIRKKEFQDKCAKLIGTRPDVPLSTGGMIFFLLRLYN